MHALRIVSLNLRTAFSVPGILFKAHTVSLCSYIIYLTWTGKGWGHPVFYFNNLSCDQIRNELHYGPHNLWPVILQPKLPLLQTFITFSGSRPLLLSKTSQSHSPIWLEATPTSEKVTLREKYYLLPSELGSWGPETGKGIVKSISWEWWTPQRVKARIGDPLNFLRSQQVVLSGQWQV